MFILLHVLQKCKRQYCTVWSYQKEKREMKAKENEMLGKTHLAVGMAVSMVLIKPETVQELLIGSGAAAVGAVISDIDVGTTESHHDSDVITAMAFFAILGVAVLDFIFHIGVYRLLMADSNIARLLTGIIAFIGVCAFGKEQPHRSFMHSFLALIILSAIVMVILPSATPYFAVAFLSHIITDLFNFKRVQLLYPLSGGISFHLFHARGIANSILLSVGTVISIVAVLRNVLSII